MGAFPPSLPFLSHNKLYPPNPNQTNPTSLKPNNNSTPSAIMTEAGRKDLSDKVQEKATPESSKSTTDKLKEGVTDTTDKAQRDLSSDDNKSAGQSMADKAGREKDSNKGGESIVDKAKDTLGMGQTSRPALERALLPPPS